MKKRNTPHKDAFASSAHDDKDFRTTVVFQPAFNSNLEKLLAVKRLKGFKGGKNDMILEALGVYMMNNGISDPYVDATAGLGKNTIEQIEAILLRGEFPEPVKK